VQKPASEIPIDSVIDTELQVNQPQRIKAPQHLNAPERLQGATIDEELLMKAFSPAAHRDIYHMPDTELPKLPSTVTTTSDKFGFDTLIADARMMVAGVCWRKWDSCACDVRLRNRNNPLDATPQNAQPLRRRQRVVVAG